MGVMTPKLPACTLTAPTGNPVTQLPNYRQALLSVLPQLNQLDNLASSDPVSVIIVHAYTAVCFSDGQLVPWVLELN